MGGGIAPAAERLAGGTVYTSRAFRDRLAKAIVASADPTTIAGTASTI
jgi:hypothetical protein